MKKSWHICKFLTCVLPVIGQGVRRAVGKQAEVINKVVLRSVPESFPGDENYEGPLMSIDAKPVASEMQVLQGSIEPNVNIKRRSGKFFDATKKLPNVDVNVQELDGWQHVPPCEMPTFKT